jgi:hypothetical protein
MYIGYLKKMIMSGSFHENFSNSVVLKKNNSKDFPHYGPTLSLGL